MSYCRFGPDSDVYVYRSSLGIECCGCLLAHSDDPSFGIPEEMIEHLGLHVAAGHKVPEEAFERLRQGRMTHPHDYRLVPAAMEDGDWTRRCAVCSQREPTMRFPYIPPGSNAIKRMHHHEIARWRRQIRDDTFLLVGRARPRAELPEKARLTLDFRWRTRHKRDPGNFVEGTKALVDMLKGRWFVDDDTEHLEMLVKGRVGTGEPDHILVTLEELP